LDETRDRSFGRTQDRLRRHVQALIGERHPQSSPAALQRAADYLSKTFQALGLTVTAHAFAAPGGTFHNVVATLPAATASGAAPLIVAAHYDTVAGSPGADDNASGLAVLLETAARLDGTARPRELRCIAFGLEEDNLRGSRAYVAGLRKSRQEIHGAIVLECVGYARKEEGSQRKPPGLPIEIPTTGDFLGVVGNEAGKHLVAAIQTAARRPKVAVKTVPLVVPGRGDRLPDTRRSDHAAFWDEGYPAVMLTDTANFRNPHYHQPTDTMATLDFRFMAGVAEALAAAVLALTEV
jgi:aminopeptidase YwaD